MKDNLAKFALILAGMGLKESDLRILLADLRSAPINEVVRRVAALAETGATWKLDQPTSDLPTETQGRHPRDATVGERVERLLRYEANLPTAVAYDLLAKMLVESGALRKEEVPPLSKKALRVWVEKVLQRVPAKEVLRLATIARNEHVHSPRPDWSIGKPSE